MAAVDEVRHACARHEIEGARQIVRARGVQKAELDTAIDASDFPPGICADPEHQAGERRVLS
ncbi:hypothetical protein [Maritimibacter sp. UBA3975]|uniref:hypothetical protein n=1 Tax=Maritimibacter sp. UBA3975 TaxID=1946833 RepID=UPI0025C04C98|nr:hypothetical protein [Maritimibacter sp. UBA3975]